MPPQVRDFATKVFQLPDLDCTGLIPDLEADVELLPTRIR